MMKTIYLVAAVAVGALLWKRGRAMEAGKNKIVEATHTDGTNWQGGDVYARMAGLDLLAPVSRNLNNSVNADPGNMGQRAAGFMPNWNGSLP